MLLKGIVKLWLFSFVFFVNAAEGEPRIQNSEYKKAGLYNYFTSQEIESSIDLYNFSKRIWLYALEPKEIAFNSALYDYVNENNIQDAVFAHKIGYHFRRELQNTKAASRIRGCVFNICVYLTFIPCERKYDNFGNEIAPESMDILFIGRWPECLNNLTVTQINFINDLNAIDEAVVRHYIPSHTGNVRHDDVTTFLDYSFSKLNITLQDIIKHRKTNKAEVLAMLNSFTPEQRKIIVEAFMIKENASWCVIS